MGPIMKAGTDDLTIPDFTWSLLNDHNKPWYKQAE